MSTIFILFASVLLIPCLYANYLEEDGVLVLTTDNFHSALKQFNYLFVEFYSPWCGHCKAIAPEFSKAAQALKEQGSEIKLAKVDATVETALKDEYAIKGYPTIKFFMKEKQRILDYSAGRNANDMIRYLNKKVGLSAPIITTIQELSDLYQNNKFILVGFFKDFNSEGCKTFQEVIFNEDKYVAVITNTLFDIYSLHEDTIIAFKKFDEERVDLVMDFSYSSIMDFILKYRLPLVSEYNQESAEDIFNDYNKLFSILFAKNQEELTKSHIESFRKSAEKYRGKAIYIYVDVDQEDNKASLEFFGIKDLDIPTIRGINLTSVEHYLKYKQDINLFDVDSINTFVEDFVTKKIKPYYMTEDVPADWDVKPVKVLVGKSFNDVLKNSKKNILVNFYAPWCGICQKLEPIYDELGEMLNEKSDTLIAKMDASTNELESVKIPSFPTIKLFIKDSNTVIDYNGERKLESLLKFVESNGKIIDAPAEDQAASQPIRDEL